MLVLLIKFVFEFECVDFEYKTQEGGELCPCLIFADQALRLFLPPDRGDSSRQNCGNK